MHGVVDALQYAHAHDLRVRIWYGDPSTGKSWNEEYEVVGYIGKSMGPQQMFLILPNRRSMGGMPVMVDKVIRITSVKPRNILFSVYNFDPGKFTMKVKKGTPTGHDFMVYKNGSNIANFKTEKQAHNWIAFMVGERFSK